MDSDTIRVTGPAVEFKAPAVDSAEPDGSRGRDGLVGPVGVEGWGALGSRVGGGTASWVLGEVGFSLGRERDL